MRLSEVIHEHQAVMIGRSTCPFCKRAKKILREASTDVKVYDIDLLGPEGNHLREQVRHQYQHPTVPAIFIEGEFIGGCDDLERLQKSGKLAGMLSA